MRVSTAVSPTRRDFARSKRSRREVSMSMSKSRLHQLSELGQSVWIDFLSREMLQTGELERLMRDDAVVGITSNPTIFQKAISQGDVYDEQIRASLAEVDDPKEIFWRLAESGGDAWQVASVASFFVSRVDTETDKRLDELGGHDELKGKLAVANAKLAYQRYNELFSGERWAPLAAKGATPQRCLWASTSTKNPAYRDVLYVEELIGPETVNTMPEETIRAFQDHGEAALTLGQGLDEAKRLFEQLAEAGIDYDDVVRVLEEEGVQKFADSFAELLDGISAKRGELAAA